MDKSTSRTDHIINIGTDVDVGVRKVIVNNLSVRTNVLHLDNPVFYPSNDVVTTIVVSKRDDKV